MSEDKITVPPFKALLAFWAAATHDRLVDAAGKIGVTESAVSHQIKQLEANLHVQLFDRSSGRLELTSAGLRYLERIEPALREIQAATDDLLPTRGRQAVRLTLPSSLAATWLIPRLGRFELAEPEIDVQLVLTARIVNMRRDQVDLAIRYGRGSWDGVDATFLFEDLATPVAAPGVVPPTIGFDQLPETVRIIINRGIPGEWDEWTRARGLPPPRPDRALTLDSIDQALQLAEAGHGLAMGRSPYAQPKLQAGTLVAPFGAIGPTGAAYYLCVLSDEPLTAAARKLARWLVSEGSALPKTGEERAET